MNGPIYTGEQNRLTEGQLEMHRSHLRRYSYARLLETYQIYLKALTLGDKGAAPRATSLQYFVETWRELRRRQTSGAPENSERPVIP